MIQSQRPNILFIMTDEQRFDAVGYINKEVITPNLDALAKESIVFNNAYTTNPSCVPARAAIFTGKYPSQCGAPTYITYANDDEKTFMKLLQETGYYTAVVGKQHFGDSRIVRGYDFEEIVDRHGPSINKNSQSCPYIQMLTSNGVVSADELTKIDGRYTHAWIGEAEKYIDSFIGSESVDWLKNKCPKDKPWFFCASFPGPHMPFDGIGLPQEKLYDQNELSIPSTKEEDLNNKPPHFWEQLEKGSGNPGIMPVKGMTEDEIRRTKLSYYTNVTLIDEMIGQIIDELKRQGQYDNTMIIFTTDHGDFMGDFGMVGKGQYLSEALMRIPFLIKPAISGFKGKIESSLISSVDIAATCLTAADIQIPEDMQSRDLGYYSESYEDHNDIDTIYMEAQSLRAVRTKEWKIVCYKDREYGELYNLAEDSCEKCNLWNSPLHKDIKLSLMKILIDKMMDLGTKSKTPWNFKAPAI